MAHGLPDWYRGVDVAYQALARLVTRPSYGKAISDDNVVTTSDPTYTFVSISGKGIIYSGYIRCQSYTYKPVIEIDGEEATATYVGLDQFMSANIVQYSAAYVTILCWDAVNKIYTFALQPGLTFDESFVLRISADYASHTYHYQVMYALIS